MPAKPYSSGHIGAVASNFTDMRLAGEAVKEQLWLNFQSAMNSLAFVPLKWKPLPLSQDPERKTLDDPFRTRLNYNRTRELMIEAVEAVSSRLVLRPFKRV